MDIAPSASSIPPDDRHQRHQRLLQELAELGMDIARAIHRQALVDPSGAPDHALAFTRIAKAIRQTLALDSRLATDQAGITRHRAAVEHRHARRRRAQIRDMVEASISHDQDADDTDSLLLDLDERLEDDEDWVLLSRPIGEVVIAICRDLGVKPDLSLWTDEMLGMEKPGKARALPWTRWGQAPPDPHSPESDSGDPDSTPL